MQKQDNKSSLTGLILIGIIFVAYSIFFPYTPEETSNSKNLDKIEEIDNYKEKDKNLNEEEKVDLESRSPEKQEPASKKEEEKTFILENDKIKLIFTNKGGEIKSAIIKGFYTYKEYSEKALEEREYIEIFNNQDSKFEISADRNVSTNELFSVQKISDKSIIFKKDYEKGSFIEYIYTLNDEEKNFVDLTINTEGISNPELVWTIGRCPLLA